VALAFIEGRQEDIESGVCVDVHLFSLRKIVLPRADSFVLGVGVVPIGDGERDRSLADAALSSLGKDNTFRGARVSGAGLLCLESFWDQSFLGLRFRASSGRVMPAAG